MMKMNDGIVDNHKSIKRINVTRESREILLNRLEKVIDFIHNKAINGRINKPENDKVRIQWFKTLAYTCSVYNQIKRDVDIDEINYKIEKLSTEIEKMQEEQ